MTCHLNSTIKFEIESSQTSCSRFCLLLMLLLMFSWSHYVTSSLQKNCKFRSRFMHDTKIHSISWFPTRTVRPLRWCCTGRFATTIFSATLRCNVGPMLQLFETMSQQCCNTVLHLKSPWQIVPCNITFKIFDITKKIHLAVLHN